MKTMLKFLLIMVIFGLSQSLCFAEGEPLTPGENLYAMESGYEGSTASNQTTVFNDMENQSVLVEESWFAGEKGKEQEVQSNDYDKNNITELTEYKHEEELATEQVYTLADSDLINYGSND